ncbi:MAG: hypothetical protein UH850_12590 [Paludibacteraceae bacterium]|nr:hypothetical protein [Paludibacteraceae bacterium]
MSTTRKFFPNHSIHSHEDIKTLVSAFQAFHFVDNERADALREMGEMIAEYNEEIRENKIAEIATAENGIISAMIPTINIDAEKAKKSAYRVSAVQFAISYNQYELITNNGRQEIKRVEKAVTVRDVYKYLLDLLKQAHADNTKNTKEDRERAEMRIIGSVENLQAIRMFMYCAYRFENVKLDEETFVTFRALTEDENKMLFAKPSKANAEKQIKWLASSLGLGDIAYKREHGLTLYKKTYTVNTKMQATVADALAVVQAFITITRYSKNGIEMPETKDRGNLFATVETAKNTDDIITF